VEGSVDARIWVVVVALGLMGLVAWLLRGRLTRFGIEVPGMKANAEAVPEQPHPTDGVHVERSRAGGTIRAFNRGRGGSHVRRSRAGEDIDARGDSTGEQRGADPNS
jgi:hypothetical protein